MTNNKNTQKKPETEDLQISPDDLYSGKYKACLPKPGIKSPVASFWGNGCNN